MHQNCFFALDFSDKYFVKFVDKTVKYDTLIDSNQIKNTIIMKKLAIIILSMSISSLCLAQTNENDSIPPTITTIPAGDIYEIEETQPILVKSYAPRRAFYTKNGKTKISHRFFAGPIIGKDDVMSPNFEGNTTDEFVEKVTEETEQEANIGFNFDYRISITPGKTDEKLCFTPNPLGFAGTFGFSAAGDFQKNYGFSCDVLAAFGFEIGTSKIGVGLEALIGTGNVTGFVLQQHETDPELSGTFKDSFMSFKYGAQFWVKIPSIFGGILGGSQQLGGDNGMRLFVRYIKNGIPPTRSIEKYTLSYMFAPESLSFGIMIPF